LETEHDISTLDELLVFQNKATRQFKPPEKTWLRVEPILETIPDEPGVYYFYDADDTLMYVGKAKSLIERVRTYFGAESVHSKKISAMVKRVHNIRWECTETELAALLLESREIKRLQPPVNIMDKVYIEYPFIKITNEALPKLEVCNGIDDDGAEYYGPFRSRMLTEQLVETIEKQFKIRKCQGTKKYSETHNPCMYNHIDACFAPCSVKDSEPGYKEEIGRVRQYLSGYSEGALAELRRRMLEHSEKLEFEKANTIKHQLGELSRLLERRNGGAASVNMASYIMIIPASERYRTLQLFFIRTGRLLWQATIGRKADLNEAFQKIDSIYFENNKFDMKFTNDDINELKIITSWSYRMRESARFVYSESLKAEEMKSELEKSVREFRFPDEIEDDDFTFTIDPAQDIAEHDDNPFVD
jgi:excinuclease UvrABC nuclease subunit